jgi:hypothetical protein
MDVGKIIVGESSRPVRDFHRVDQTPAWKALAWFALLFVSVGLVDIALVIVAADTTGPVSRMTTFAGLSTGLPLLTIGVVGFLMSGIGARSRGIVLAASVLAGLLVVGIVVGLVLMLLSSGAAYANAPPATHAAMRQGLWRAVVFYVAFGGALGIAMATGLRASRGAVET